MEIKPNHKKLITALTSYIAGYATYGIAGAAALYLGVAAFAAVTPTNKSDPLFKFKQHGSFAISFLLGTSIYLPLSKIGRRLICLGELDLDESTEIRRNDRIASLEKMLERDHHGN